MMNYAGLRKKYSNKKRPLATSNEGGNDTEQRVLEWKVGPVSVSSMPEHLLYIIRDCE